MVPRDGIWAAYASWLADQGRKPTTISNYVSQARQILAGTNSLTPENVDAFIQVKAASLHGQYRSAWRSFVAWAESNGVQVAGALPRRTTAVPDHVLQAVRLLRASGLTMKTIGALRWDVREDAALLAHFPDSIFLAAPPGASFHVVPVPSSVAEVLHAWGHPGMPYPHAGASAPLVPAWPGAPSPMPLATLSRLLRC